jgi:hypothetical protein
MVLEAINNEDYQDAKQLIKDIQEDIKILDLL